MTRGDLLRYRIAFALRRAAKIVRGLKQALSEDERFAVAEDVVDQLKEDGDPWRLSEEAQEHGLTPDKMSLSVPLWCGADPP